MIIISYKVKKNKKFSLLVLTNHFFLHLTYAVSVFGSVPVPKTHSLSSLFNIIILIIIIEDNSNFYGMYYQQNPDFMGNP
jgi:hypothetical protein